jgi:DNA-binding NarL/FixJ family response regulator
MDAAESSTFHTRHGGNVIYVGILDDHPISRWGIQRALEAAEPEIRVVGTYSSPAEVDRHADVMLVDLFLSDELPCLDLIREMATRTRVLVVSASRLSADVAASFHAGAHGYLHKGSDPARFAEAVYAVAAGGEVHALPGDDPPTPTASLSTRERQVLAFIANGYTHEQAARRLGISPHTVNTYVKRLRGKLGAGNKAHLTRAALLRPDRLAG